MIWCGFKDKLPKFGKIIGIIMIMSQVHVFSYVTKGTDCHHNSLSVEKSAELLLEHLTKDSEIMSKQHSVETHSLRSCEPGTFHIV